MLTGNKHIPMEIRESIIWMAGIKIKTINSGGLQMDLHAMILRNTDFDVFQEMNVTYTVYIWGAAGYQVWETVAEILYNVSANIFWWILEGWKVEGYQVLGINAMICMLMLGA